MEGANPIIIALMFVARCLVPLALMLAVSYILYKLGLIRDLPTPPPENGNGKNGDDKNKKNGGLLHGKV